MHIKTKNIDSAAVLARRIASLVEFPDVIALQGDLGAGKTSFAKFLINYLSEADMEVTSPTFNLVQLYETDSGEVWHFDLYRLEDTQQVWDIGIEDAFDNALSIIEWPELIEDFLPENVLFITIDFDGDEGRIYKLVPRGSWCTKLSDMEQLYEK